MRRGAGDEVRDTVLFVSSWPYLGGAQVSLATALASMRGEVRAILVAPDNGVLIDRLWERDLIQEHIVIPNRGIAGTTKTRLETARILGRWLVRNRHRLLAVHANGDSELKLLVPLLPLIRRPVVVWYHSHTLSSSTR